MLLDPKPTLHWKEGFAPSRKNHRVGLGEPSAVLNRRHRDRFELKELQTPPRLGSSAFANADVGQSISPFRVSPESNGYLSHTSPPMRIQSPVLEDFQDLAPMEGPSASGAIGTADRREKRRFVGEWYQWWLQRHREKCAAGSRQSGYKPLGEDSHQKNRRGRLD